MRFARVATSAKALKVVGVEVAATFGAWRDVINFSCEFSLTHATDWLDGELMQSRHAPCFGCVEFLELVRLR